jgi:hypothetical protein
VEAHAGLGRSRLNVMIAQTLPKALIAVHEARANSRHVAGGAWRSDKPRSASASWITRSA